MWSWHETVSSHLGVCKEHIFYYILTNCQYMKSFIQCVFENISNDTGILAFYILKYKHLVPIHENDLTYCMIFSRIKRVSIQPSESISLVKQIKK